MPVLDPEPGAVFVQRLAQIGLERNCETLLILTGFPLIHALFQNQLILSVSMPRSRAMLPFLKAAIQESLFDSQWCPMKLAHAFQQLKFSSELIYQTCSTISNDI